MYLPYGSWFIFADRKRKGVLKVLTDYRPASNSYPVKTLQRDGLLGPSELVEGLQFMFDITNNIATLSTAK